MANTLKINSKLLLNKKVYFFSEENLLRPVANTGVETHLNVPASRCLLLLLQNSGNVVSQKTFYAEVWEKHGQYVTPNTFYQNILILRKSLKIAGIEEKVIITIPKEGLKFTGKVEEVTNEDEPEPLLPVLLEETLPIAADSRAETGGERAVNVEIEVEKSVSAVPPRKFSLNKKDKFVILTSILMLLVSFAIIFQRDRINTNGYFYHYQHAAMGNCQVQYKFNAKDGDVAGILKKFNIPCENDNHIFLTVDERSSRTSFVVCDLYTINKQSCKSYLFNRSGT